MNIDTYLLGRDPVETQVDTSYITGKRILVTGAGGSIGSELCRQLHQLNPGALVMLDRDESALHEVQLSIQGRALLDDPNVVLADIRDEGWIREVFQEHQPEIVFHAAALKHQPLLERYPAEAVKTNIMGTMTVLDAAESSGVDVLVNVSTDKAADPSCVLGSSKRVTERLTAAYAPHRFLSVRFGNVLGSRGSVLTTFAAQIAAGGPVTVTHPQMTRYFMTVQEAVRLVIGAGAIGDPGQVLVLDMGEPVRIVDLVRRMAQWDISIVYTGIRPGESLEESPLGVKELGWKRHPAITQVDVPPLHPSEIRFPLDLSGGVDHREKVARQIMEFCEME